MRCRLVSGHGDDVEWDVALACDNPDCEYHREFTDEVSE